MSMSYAKMRKMEDHLDLTSREFTARKGREEAFLHSMVFHFGPNAWFTSKNVAEWAEDSFGTVTNLSLQWLSNQSSWGDGEDIPEYLLPLVGQWFTGMRLVLGTDGRWAVEMPMPLGVETFS